MKATCPKPPLHPLVATAVMDLLHVDFTSIEMTIALYRLSKGHQCPGVPGPFHKTHYGLCDPQSDH